MNASERIEALQNSVPTDWSAHDNMLISRSSGDQNRFADDAKLHVRFYTMPMINIGSSEAANRAIFEEIEMCEIMIPGDKNNIVHERVWYQTIQRFPEKYRLFKEGKSQVTGTPVGMLPFVTPSMVMEFKYFNIETVEQLAGMSDAAKQRFMGASEFSRRAQEWLNNLNSGATLRAEMDKMRAAVEAATAERDAIMAMLEEVMAKQAATA